MSLNNYVELACAVYFLFMGMICTTQNFRSHVAFKLIPILFAVYFLLHIAGAAK